MQSVLHIQAAAFVKLVGQVEHTEEIMGMPATGFQHIGHILGWIVYEHGLVSEGNHAKTGSLIMLGLNAIASFEKGKSHR